MPSTTTKEVDLKKIMRVLTSLEKRLVKIEESIKKLAKKSKTKYGG